MFRILERVSVSYNENDLCRFIMHQMLLILLQNRISGKLL
ncbi:hypothetical protein SAMN04488124_3566 [Halogeometricum limi]|uniref:Uncharacterized protein n=1 Tax=Halogeometricum limi TaxID=555875 RepID=A0A1I6IRN3_9EURY|nr:hypothetical protein SAMN04488124_3566 [Halogeometricum limi]